jgi:hypothetical protein
MLVASGLVCPYPPDVLSSHHAFRHNDFRRDATCAHIKKGKGSNLIQAAAFSCGDQSATAWLHSGKN